MSRTKRRSKRTSKLSPDGKHRPKCRWAERGEPKPEDTCRSCDVYTPVSATASERE